MITRYGHGKRRTPPAEPPGEFPAIEAAARRLARRAALRDNRFSMVSGALEESGSPLLRSSLRERIKDVMLQRILGGAYPPGSRLVETRIAQELGVSQASIREALRDLEHIGCVVYEPYRGCSVRKISIDELLEAFPVRAALEALAARLAAERMGDGELGQLRALYDTMLAAAAAGDAHEQSQADAAFHGAIVRGARNATLERQWSFLEPYLRTYVTVSRAGTDLGKLAASHLPVLEALEARDGERAAAALTTHLGDAAGVLEAHADDD